MTVAQCFLIGLIIMIGPGGLLLVVVSPPIGSPSFSFMGEFANQLNLDL
jgi:hypothetical protein